MINKSKVVKKCRTAMIHRQQKFTFTLAEVLIVIGVIGVVAAITIPTLINTINDKAKKAQTDVIETRLLDGINRYSAMEDGLSQKYETTYDFLVGLSKYYKMSQICKADEITRCIPYAKIYSSDGESSVNVSSLKTIDKFMSGDAVKNYFAPASFISAQGTPFVMALKKNCVWDMGQAMRSIEDSGCIAYLYDKNGALLPNKVGEDLVGHGLTINGFPLAILGGVKIMTTAFEPTPLTAADCSTNKSKYGISNCRTDNYDYWGGAMKACKTKGWHLPTRQQLTDVANVLYPSHVIAANGNISGAIKTELIPEVLSDLSSSWNYLWSNSEHSESYAWHQYFSVSYSYSLYRSRSDYFLRAVCVDD